MGIEQGDQQIGQEKIKEAEMINGAELKGKNMVGV